MRIRYQTACITSAIKRKTESDVMLLLNLSIIHSMKLQNQYLEEFNTLKFEQNVNTKHSNFN